MKNFYKKITIFIFSVILVFSLFNLPVFSAKADDSDIADGINILAQYNSTLYNVENGLATNDANVVLQTEDGYIWIGGYGGLIRYNGKNFRNFTTEAETSYLQNIRSLFEYNGILYIGSNDKGVYTYSNGEFSTLTSDFMSVRQFATSGVLSDKKIYVATTKGIYYIENGEMQKSPIAEFQTGTFNSIAIDDKGNIYAVDDSHSLTIAKADGSIERKIHDDNDAESLSYNSVKYHKGYVYIGSYNQELIKINTQTNQTEVLSIGDLQTVNSLYVDANDRIWLCCDNGIAMLVGDEVQNANSFFNFNDIENIIVDYQNNIWLSSSREGVFKLSSGSFVHYSSLIGLDGTTVNSTAYYDNSIFIATDSGLFCITKGGELQNNSLTDLLSQKAIRTRCLIADDFGNLWICTYKTYGLIKYNAESEEITFYNSTALDETTDFSTEFVASFDITQQNILNSSKIRNVLPMDATHIAIGTGDSGLKILNTETNAIVSIDDTNGLNNNAILSMSQSDEKLYLGTDGGGLSIVDKTDFSVENITTNEGLASGVLLRTTYDKNQQGLWISAGNYLQFFDGTTVKTIDKLLAGVGSIFEIKVLDDKLWIFRPTSIVEVKTSNLLDDSEFEYSIAERNDGLTSTVTANSFSGFDDEGNCYISSCDGVFVFKQFNSNQSLPKVKIILDSIEVENKVLSPNKSNLTIQSEDNERLTFNFSALSFTERPYCIYYYLEGYDEEAIKIDSHTTSVSYTKLAGGKYTFHIYTVNEQGEKSEEILYSFEQKGPIYTRWWFITLIVVLCIIVVAGLITLSYILRIRSFMKRQAAYREITRESLKTIANTIDAKDHYTNGHSMRVAMYSCGISNKLGFTEKQIEDLYYTALMHDVGKIGVPDEILNKPSKLTNEEFDVIKHHVTIGADILKSLPALPHVVEGAKYHHEKYDGTGYVYGLRGEEIPLIARIICVADCFDAMNSTRIYRPNLSKEKIISEFERCKSTQFDPKIADIMIDLIKSGEADLIIHENIDSMLKRMKND